MGIEYQNNNTVLIISSEFPPGPGGIGTHAISIANAFQKRGINVVINTISNYVNREEEINYDNNYSFKIYRFKNYGSILVRWYHRLNIIRSTIRLFRIKNVFVSGRFSIWVIPFIRILGVSNIVAIIHGTELGKTIFFKWTIFCLKKANNIVAISEFTRSLITENIIDKVCVINNGIDPSIWKVKRESKYLENFPILLTVGTISLRKGQYNVIKMLPHILKVFPNMHYHCVGDYKEKKSLLELIDKLNLINQVTVHGFLEHCELERLYTNSHVNMMLSNHKSKTDYEGFGISVLEGNLFGVPAIGARNTGLRDSIKPNINGELVDPQNHKEIIKSLERIFLKYDYYSKQSKNHAKINTWDSKIVQYEKFIQ